MATPSKQDAGGSRWTVSTEGWPVENWVALIVLASLALLILIRMGFRGISVPGVGSANLS
jgi:hypothetical protein